MANSKRCSIPKYGFILLLRILHIIKSTQAYYSYMNNFQTYSIGSTLSRQQKLQIHRNKSQLSLAPQQLGEFESLEFSKDTEFKGNSYEIRQVRLYDIVTNNEGNLIHFSKAWDFQKQLLQLQLDRIQSEMGNNQNGAAPLISTQWLSSMAMRPDEADKVQFRGDSIIMLEHEPVYTLGTGSDPSFIKAENHAKENAVEVVRIERGGEVTYHGPGQLVVYPIVDLRGYKQDIHWYMRALEEAILIALQSAGIRNVSVFIT